MTNATSTRSVSLHVVIVTYNAAPWLDFCLPPLAGMPPKWKTVVVDNASADTTPALLAEKFPWVEVINSPKNLGFGRANNLALRKALEENADYVFLLNQDARIAQEDLARLIDIHERNSDYFIVSPVHLNGPGDEIDLPFAAACAPHYCPGLYIDALTGKLKELYPMRKNYAAAWLLNRTCLKAVGGFNPLYFHYGEDDDYVNRVLFHGGKIGVTPLAFARHGREQKVSTRPPDRHFIRKLTRMVDPGNKAPSVPQIAGAFIPAIVRNLCRKRTSAAKHYWRGMLRLLRNRLSFPPKPNPSTIKGAAYLDVGK